MTFSHYRAHAATLYKSLGILQLQDVIFIQMAKFMYDYNNNNLPCAFINYFKHSSEVHHHFTRYSVYNYQMPSARTNYGKFSLRFTGVKIWHQIDDHIKLMNKYNFIKRLKINCLDSYH
jgi:hypothetical protein